MVHNRRTPVPPLRKIVARSIGNIDIISCSKFLQLCPLLLYVMCRPSFLTHLHVSQLTTLRICGFYICAMNTANVGPTSNENTGSTVDM